jgi:hypothetical protein
LTTAVAALTINSVNMITVIVVLTTAVAALTTAVV